MDFCWYVEFGKLQQGSECYSTGVDIVTNWKGLTHQVVVVTNNKLWNNTLIEIIKYIWFYTLFYLLLVLMLISTQKIKIK